MKIVIEEKKRNFTVMSNHHFRNSELSFKAMGLLSFMLSLPEDWDFSVEGLAHCAKDGRDSISTGLKELEQKGYLFRRKVRNERGHIVDVEYVVCEEPQQLSTTGEGKEPEIDEPVTDFPETVKSDLEKNISNSKNVIKSTFLPETGNPETVKSERIYPFTENPITENPITENPITENPQQINTNIINTKILNTKEINTDDYSSSSDDEQKIIKDYLNFNEAVKLSSKEVAEMVYEEIVRNRDLLQVIDADRFKSICENIALFSKNICNQKAYVQVCIKNMLKASKVNDSTVNGVYKNFKQKSNNYVRISG